MVDVGRRDAMQYGRDVARQSAVCGSDCSLYLLSFVIIVFSYIYIYIYIGRIYFLAVCVDANLWLMFPC